LKSGLTSVSVSAVITNCIEHNPWRAANNSFSPIVSDRVHLVRRPLYGLVYEYKPRVIDDDECEAVSGIIGKVNPSTRRKPASMTLCASRIPHDMIWVRS
jgi:hypothetical protein